jgi:hypothetical protein
MSNIVCTNQERADKAKAAVKAYVALGGSGEIDADLRDLICDLLHLARFHGLDPRAEVEGAIGMWSAEDRNPDPDGIDYVTVTICEATTTTTEKQP